MSNKKPTQAILADPSCDRVLLLSISSDKTSFNSLVEALCTSTSDTSIQFYVRQTCLTVIAIMSVPIATHKNVLLYLIMFNLINKSNTLNIHFM